MRSSTNRYEIDEFDEAPKPRRKAKPPQPAPARAIALPAPHHSMLSVLLARPGATIACAAFAALMTGIAVNALFLQKGRHPAPLFSAKPAAHAAPVAAPAAPPAPAKVAPVDDEDAPPAPAQQKAVAPSPPMRPAALAEAKPAAAKAEGKTDSIGALLRSGPAAAADQGKTILSAQRALAKLGHAIKADGAMGPGTRQAIEKFEREHKLPVTGELNPRTMRKLSAVAGMAVE